MEYILFKGSDCSPCKSLEAFLQAHKVEYKSVMAADNPKEAMQRKIRTVPTLLILEDGEETHRFVGLSRLDELSQVIQQAC